MKTENSMLLHRLLWALVPYNALVGLVNDTMQPTKISLWMRQPSSQEFTT